MLPDSVVVQRSEESLRVTVGDGLAELNKLAM
jgi:hypothetical protein